MILLFVSGLNLVLSRVILWLVFNNGLLIFKSFRGGSCFFGIWLLMVGWGGFKMRICIIVFYLFFLVRVRLFMF